MRLLNLLSLLLQPCSGLLAVRKMPQEEEGITSCCGNIASARKKRMASQPTNPTMFGQGGLNLACVFDVLFLLGFLGLNQCPRVVPNRTIVGFKSPRHTTKRVDWIRVVHVGTIEKTAVSLVRFFVQPSGHKVN